MSEVRDWPRIAVVGAGAVGGYFGGVLARAGAPTVFIGRKHFVDAVNVERSCSRQIGRPAANLRHGDNRYQRGARLLADSVLCKSTRYLGDRGTNGSIC